MKTKQRKVDVANLEIGMYVGQLDRDWLDSPFMLQGFLLNSEEQIEEVRKICKFVYIDVTLGKDVPDSLKKISGRVPGNGSGKNGDYDFTTIPSPPTVPFEDEIKQAKRVHKRLSSIVNDLFYSATTGKHLDISQAKEVVHEVVNSINRNQYALEWMTQLKNKDEYTAIHSMNVCILSVKLGKHIGFSQDDLNMVGLCGMLHDIGKLNVPIEILNKPGSLTEPEMEIMRHHADMGANLLKNTKGTPEEAYHTALTHHEKLDGTGYPSEMPSGNINMFTRIVSIADIYDAVTSERVYHTSMQPHEANSLLYSLREHHLDAKLVEAFIQCVGVYPVGTIVETKNGEVGLVVSSSDRHRINPYILMVLNQSKGRISKPYIVNTARMKDDQGHLKYEIKGALDTNSYSLSPRDFFD